MSGIRALCLFASVAEGGEHALIYEKRFPNVEVCARSVQQTHNYVNFSKLRKVEELLKEQIIKRSLQEVETHSEFVQLNRTICCYSVRVKNKIVCPFLLMRSNSFILIILLLMENVNTESPQVVEAENNTNKLLYYNFMKDFLTYVEGKMVNRASSLLSPSYRQGSHNKVVVLLQKIRTIGDAYITCTIPFGRLLGGRSSSFINYLQGDMYKRGEVLQSTFFPFYNFLILVNKDSVHQGRKDKPSVCNSSAFQGGSESGLSEGRLQFTSPSQQSDSDKDSTFSSDDLEDENSSMGTLEKFPCAVAKGKEKNDVLYINAKPPFVPPTEGAHASAVHTRGIHANGRIRETFLKLLKKFYTLARRDNQGLPLLPPNAQYHLYLFFLYNYSARLGTHQKISVEKHSTEKESVRISRGNIQTYVPIYVHERSNRSPTHLLIREELTGFVTSLENQTAEVKGEILLQCDDERYLDVDLTLELDDHVVDVYAADFVNMENRYSTERGKTLHMRVATKDTNNTVLTYYCSGVPSPLIGCYTLKKVSSKCAQVDVTLQWNRNAPSIRFDKKITEPFFVRLPFDGEIVGHNLKCNLGKIKIEGKQEIKWTLLDLPRESRACLYGTVQLSHLDMGAKQLAAEIHLLSKCAYSKTAVTHVSEEIHREQFFHARGLKLLRS
ncbi:hypothetical protein AK88_04803 [Plasmodium fragile]|uniref:MHD domain-containing protein n=1 Tax=Plasmodium fragile TaxID=5857 RepID=A0A0D9QFK7_PLAFR|nr:uncharacterized protein AK88_04803 [Plasmodium fragile]KJP85582.1 hypothetical protein AK88_04803 [Plasmodium fragile]